MSVTLRQAYFPVMPDGLMIAVIPTAAATVSTLVISTLVSVVVSATLIAIALIIIRALLLLLGIG